MKCILCTKQGKPVNGLKVDVVACDEHSKLYKELETNHDNRTYGTVANDNHMYKNGRRIR